MSTPVEIIGEKNKAVVSKIGQLITSPYTYDTTKFLELDATGTAFNFYTPKVGLQFVISGFRGKAARSVSTTVDADIVIYESDADDSTTELRIIYQDALIRGEDFNIFPANILVSEGNYVNAKTTDASIYMNIFGYYIPKIED
jgi:hypothetical protein